MNLWILFKKSFFFTLLLIFISACSDITTQQILQKYRENPRQGGIREDIITHDILPDIRKDAQQDLIAIEYAQSCFSKAKSIEEAEVCRHTISSKYGQEYSFEAFTKWNDTIKQKVLDFLASNKASVECYAKAKKAHDILPCKDPIEPNF